MRSSAVGDLNDFNSYFSNFENPIIQLNERALLPFDAPNHFLFWGDFHIKYGIRLAPVLEMRNGFPFSIVDENRNFVGPRDRAGRFPTFASLDLQVMKGIRVPGRWKKYRVEVGLKVFNVTKSFQPARFPEQPGERRLWHFLERRRSEVWHAHRVHKAVLQTLRFRWETL